jgi:hypothetical protein
VTLDSGYSVLILTECHQYYSTCARREPSGRNGTGQIMRVINALAAKKAFSRDFASTFRERFITSRLMLTCQRGPQEVREYEKRFVIHLRILPKRGCTTAKQWNKSILVSSDKRLPLMKKS